MPTYNKIKFADGLTGYQELNDNGETTRLLDNAGHELMSVVKVLPAYEVVEAGVSPDSVDLPSPADVPPPPPVEGTPVSKSKAKAKDEDEEKTSSYRR
jgi:hypothetical protein